MNLDLEPPFDFDLDNGDFWTTMYRDDNREMICKDMQAKAPQPIIPEPEVLTFGQKFDFTSNSFLNARAFRADGKKLKIKPYDSKVNGQFFGVNGDESNPLMMGIELEYEVQDAFTGYIENFIYEADSCLNKCKNFCLIKRDGSLKNNGYYGFEICSNPATFDFHKNVWKDFFLNKNNLKLECSERTGIHIHVSKNAISSLKIGKIVAFIHKKENRLLIKKIAGRGTCTHSDLTPKLGINAVKKHSFTHYSAINAGLANTVEFRIFAGTTNYNRLLSYIEFVHSIIAFCGVCSSKSACSKIEYLAFLNSDRNRLDYAHLIDYLYNNGYSLSLRGFNRKAPKDNFYKNE